jgi:tRNA-binding protein
MTPAPIKPLISSDYLGKIDVRVGTVLTVEDVPTSDKLVRLKVDFGDHTRSILAGMKKERQNPKAEIEGKQALFVVNLEPRKMAGEFSEGMIFDIAMPTKWCPSLDYLKSQFRTEHEQANRRTIDVCGIPFDSCYGLVSPSSFAS